MLLTAPPADDTLSAARKRMNPLPEGKNGMSVLRGLSECPVPGEAETIKKLMEKMMAVNIVDVDATAETLGKGLAAIVMADAFCQQHSRKRVAACFKDNEELYKLHEECHSLHSKMLRLHQELTQVSQEIQAKLKQRWEIAEKRFGLAPEKYSYQIDEESGTIYLVDLDCDKCKGQVKARQARQAISEKLVSFERAREHVGQTGAAQDPGKDSPQE